MTAPTPRLSPSGQQLPPASTADLPLSSVVFADKGTLVPSGDQNGAITTPFAGLAAAFGVALAGDVIKLAPTTLGASYGDLSGIAKTVSIESLALTELPLFGPSGAVVTQLGALALAPTTVIVLGLAGLTFDSLSLDETGGGNCIVSALGCQCTGTVTGVGTPTTGTVGAFNSAFDGDVLANGLNARGCVVGGATTVVGLTAIDSSFVGLVTIANDIDARVCDFQGGISSQPGSVLTLRFSTVAGGISAGSNVVIESCQVDGGLTVGNNLTIDQASYQYALDNGGVTVTGTLTVTDATIGQTVNQLGWNPASSANSNVLTVKAAPHPPGIYAINFSGIVQANATALTTFAYKTSFGQSGVTITDQNSLSGTPFTSGAVPRLLKITTVSPPIAIEVPSDGTKPLSIQFLTTGATGTPSIDLYASATLVGNGN